MSWHLIKSSYIVVNTAAYDLIKEGRARWIYCNEGNNNIAVIYKLNDPSSEPIGILERLENKVFRVKKAIKAKYIGKVIPDEIEYSQYFDKYIAQRDPGLSQYISKLEEVTLSLDVVKSIQEQIKETRDQMIAEARINYPLKTFQDIDMKLRRATVMPNMSSSYSSVDDGIVKHTELKFGLIVPKPMQKSFIEHLKSTYTLEQLESTDYFKDKSRFTAKQASLVVSGKAEVFWNFDPYDILRDKEWQTKCLKELFKNGTGYAKIFEEGKQYEVTNTDINTIIGFLNTGILEQVKRFEEVDMSDLDEITELYLEVSESDPDPAQSIRNYFENFSMESAHLPDPESLEHKWKRVMDWVVAETIKDSSIMIKWKEIQFNEELKTELIDMKIIDIDTKLWTKLPDYQKEMYEFFCDYAEFLYNPGKYPLSL